MEKLQEYPDPETKEKYLERALSSIYFLQKCLDFEKGGELAVRLFKVYEYCRKQVIQFTVVDSKVTLEQAIFIHKHNIRRLGRYEQQHPSNFSQA